MTTRIRIMCPDNSHGKVRVICQEKVYDLETKKLTDEWDESLYECFVLKQGKSRDVYLYSSRRYLIEEIEPVEETLTEAAISGSSRWLTTKCTVWGTAVHDPLREML